ncbi:Lysosomal alpha-mannosidase [Strongyloides ratti]|uniref:Lysosomal alpha-mannosidase n=1 Tax=Strongyloides ratti TaxID=34506 RepID=A0A090LNF7_STRRB|nr:Lysosomal alpha-mannosidase [Strongyloides ratti]CEF69684.1 Lysosomal alpha-mannosidase [Strongyloides ratti]
MIEGWDDGETILNSIVNKVGSIKGKQLPTMILCKKLNESICIISEESSQFTVTVFNSYHDDRNIFVRVPINHNSVKVLDDNGNIVQNQVLETFKTSQLNGNNKFEVIFEIKFKGIGFITYFIQYNNNKIKKISKNNNEKNLLENDNFKITFDDNGYIQNITNKQLNITFPFNITYSYYIGCGKNDFQPSGAYIFSPINSTTVSFNMTINTTTLIGPFVNETRQQISPWVSHSIRLYKNVPYIEIQWTVGPIPKEKFDPIGKELIIRYTTTLQNNGQFITDSNGRQSMSRKTNYAPDYTYKNTDPITANYYPITNKVSINDDKYLFSVLVDRAQGVGGLKDGELEIMLHRRAFHDDYLGVEEPLDELGEDGKGLIARGIHRIYIGDKNLLTTKIRDDSISFFKEPIIMFSKINNITINEYKDNFITNYKFLEPSLPKGINILSIESLNDISSEWLFRLEQIYEGDEMGVKSQPITVDFDKIFSPFKIERIIETDIQGIEEKNDTNKKNMLKNNKIYMKKGKKLYMNKLENEVSVLPMEIRTFKIYLKN